MKHLIRFTLATLLCVSAAWAQQTPNLNGDYVGANGTFFAVAAGTNSVAFGSTNWVAIKPNGNQVTVVQGITMTTCTNATRINFLTPWAVLDVIATNAVRTNLVVPTGQTNANYNGKFCLFNGAQSNIWLRGIVSSATGTNTGGRRYDGTVSVCQIDNFTTANSLSWTNYWPKPGDKLYILEKSAVRFYPSSLTNNQGLACNAIGGVIGQTWEPNQPIFIGKPYPLNPVVVELDPTVVLAITPTASITNWIWNVWGSYLSQ
jgi:hypothetical protein